MLYKVINIEYCTPCDGVGIGDSIQKQTDRNVPLHKNSKTDNSDLRKKYLNHQLSIVFAKNLIKFREILSNSLKRCRRGWTEDTKPKYHPIFSAADQKVGNNYIHCKKLV